VSVATDTDLWSMSATALAGAIRSKQASCREVIQAHLRRIEAQLIERAGHNPHDEQTAEVMQAVRDFIPADAPTA
jgi:Asp-tRNA(Asn)/Glu-tRNA(Gln) amidotransferase A subunit family amidase